MTPQTTLPARTAVLESHMKDLIGNGQPGRIDKLEVKVDSHSKLIWIGMGGLAVLQILHANGALNIAKLLGK